MKATIAEIKEVRPIEGRDRIQEALVLGSWVITTKDYIVGTVGIYFSTEGLIHESFLKENNLYKDASLNKDPKVSGFFEDSGRVKTLKFGKGRSDGFFAKLETLKAYVDISKLKVGDDVSKIGDFELCTRYIKQDVLKDAKNPTPKQKKFALFLEHSDTENFWYNSKRIPTGAKIYITEKLHGTSGRYARLPLYEKGFFANLKRKVQKLLGLDYHKYMVGSRRVVWENLQDGFYGKNDFRFEVLDDLGGFPKNLTIYGEIVGNVNGRPIMSHSLSELPKEYKNKFGDTVTYNYGAGKGHKFYVYRITEYDEVKDTYRDYTYAETEGLCKLNGWNMPLKLTEFVYNGDVDWFEAKVKELTENEKNLSESYTDPKTILEGVVVRIELERKTTFLKSKSFVFKLAEGLETVANVEEVS